MRKEKIVVVLENKIYVYKFADLKLVESIDTCSNVSGLVALNTDGNNEVLATPDKESGHVRIALYHKNKNHIIKAHENTITCLALNPDGRILATSSQKGTLIRLFNTASGNTLTELRRGSGSANIFAIAFDRKTNWVAVTSDRSTIHVFAISKEIIEQLYNSGTDALGYKEEVKDEPKNSKKFGFFGSVFKGNKYVNSETSFMQFTLKANSADNKAYPAFSEDSSTLIVVN